VIAFENSAVLVQCDVGQRGEFIEVGVTIACRRQLDLGVSKLFVLKFQLDLMDFEFMDETPESTVFHCALL
jgi:hypothetical protein